jgi:hypothetical protein
VHALAALCRETEHSAEALLSSVCEPRVALADLEVIKTSAKELLARANDDPERTAAALLYHLAVAAALARHGKNISSRSLHSRLGLYEKLADVWAGDPVGEVFRSAVDRLASAV